MKSAPGAVEGSNSANMSFPLSEPVLFSHHVKNFIVSQLLSDFVECASVACSLGLHMALLERPVDCALVVVPCPCTVLIGNVTALYGLMSSTTVTRSFSDNSESHKN